MHDSYHLASSTSAGRIITSENLADFPCCSEAYHDDQYSKLLHPHVLAHTRFHSQVSSAYKAATAADGRYSLSAGASALHNLHNQFEPESLASQVVSSRAAHV